MKTILELAAIAVVTLSLPVSAAAPPSGWFAAGSAPKSYEFDVDTGVASEGRRSATISAKDDKPEGFGTLMQSIAADDYRGSRVRLSAAIRTRDAARAQMWMRVDGPDHKSVAFDNMDPRPVTGTQDWSRYAIVLDVPHDAASLNYGVFLLGAGKLWFDDVRLEKVDSAVPLTGQAASLSRAPLNTGFEN